MVMPAPRRIPVLLVLALVDSRRIVMMAMSVQPIAVMLLPDVRTAIILISVMMAMPVPRQIPVQLVPVSADHLLTVMMVISVQPIAVMPLPGVKTAIILIPVMTVMPVRRQIPALPESVWADLRRTATMGMSVPMTPVIPQAAA